MWPRVDLFYAIAAIAGDTEFLPDLEIVLTLQPHTWDFVWLLTLRRRAKTLV